MTKIQSLQKYLIKFTKTNNYIPAQAKQQILKRGENLIFNYHLIIFKASTFQQKIMTHTKKEKKYGSFTGKKKKKNELSLRKHKQLYVSRQRS